MNSFVFAHAQTLAEAAAAASLVADAMLAPATSERSFSGSIVKAGASICSIL